MATERTKISIHPGARHSYERSAAELLSAVKSFPLESSKPTPAFDIHPSAVVGEKDILGVVTTTRRLVNLAGSETGRFFDSDGQRFGWVDEQFQHMRRLAERIARSQEFRDIVSYGFVLDQIFTWLTETLQRKRADALTDFITEQVRDAVEDHEIYVPLYRTYSSQPLTIGRVEFKSVSKELLDKRFPPEPLSDREMESRVRAVEQRTRAKYQGTLAACIKIHAEKRAAEEYALRETLNATALLRFLSPANFTATIRSYTLPIGMQNALTWDRFDVNNGSIGTISSSAIQSEPFEWIIDDSYPEMPKILAALSELANNQDSEFRKRLFDAILVYSRNSTSLEPADKLLFVLVALESMLIRDGNEAIQSNLGDRLAFLIGEGLAERKQIVATVKDTYAIRSKFVHHGQGVDDIAILDDFLLFAWTAFSKFLAVQGTFQNRADLLNKLDEMKLS